MSSSAKRWEFAPECPPDVLAGLSQHHPLLVQMLFNRKVTEPAAVEEFLNPPAQYRDPFGLLGMETAVRRIRAAIRADESIAVYGDFDADGVTSTALMVQTLTALGGRATPYIPHRVDEGYGLNCAALDRLAAEGTRLVITVDCGIRSIAEVAHGQSRGLDMIVTDHHSLARDAEGRDILPPAVAVINPRQQGDTSPFKDFAGVGLAFKLAQGLARADQRDPLHDTPSDFLPRDVIDLVALGTVADVIPLVGENRLLVRRGLEALRQSRRPGIIEMLKQADLRPEKVMAQSIGFVLGPRLNAAGRLGSAETAYKLLTATDQDTARPLAERLGALNKERQERTLALVELAKAHIAEREGARFLHLIPDAEFHYGIMGLVAGRLTEELYRPVLVAKIAETETRGSGRSIPEFHITHALDQCSDLLVRHGGHAAAAGFTVRNENLPELTARLEAIAEAELSDKSLTPVLKIDALFDLADPDFGFCELLGQLEPHGEGNPQPVFATLGMEIVPGSVRTVGAEGQHLKFRARVPGSRTAWEAIAFRMGEWAGGLPARIDLAYSLEVIKMNGYSTLQLVVKDIRPA